MRQAYAQFADRGVEVVVVSPEAAPAFAAYWQKARLPFVGLPDPEDRVLRLYGQEVNWLKLGRMPAQVLVDKEGIVRYVHYGSSMRDITPVEDIIALVDGLDREKGAKTGAGSGGAG